MENVWQYLGNFDDGEAFRIWVLLVFLFGAPLMVGLWAKVAVWSTREVRNCQKVLTSDTVDV